MRTKSAADWAAPWLWPLLGQALLLLATLLGCFKRRRSATTSSSEHESARDKDNNKESAGAEGGPRNAPPTDNNNNNSSSGANASASNADAEPAAFEDHTGDTYKEVRPRSDQSRRNLLSVAHLDRTDTIVPAGLNPEEQKILLRAMSKGSKRMGFESAEKAPKIEKVITFATSDDITYSEYSEPPNALGGFAQPQTDPVAEADELNLDTNVTLDPLLVRMIQNGPRQFKFKFEELLELLNRGTDLFSKECSLLEVPVPCVIYGDIHGQYSDLHRWFNLNGWPNRTRTVFLGDFVDRGSHGVEVVALLVLLKLHFPDRVFIVRGNHEEESLNKAYSFYEEVVARFNADDPGKTRGPAIYNAFKQLFMQLPLAVLVGKRLLGMHGGISPKMRALQDIRDIRRPIDDFEVGSLECDLVWSDPDTNAETRGFRPNLEREPQNGIGQLFGQECVKEACQRLGIDLMIRGHQAPLHGYAFFAEGKMMTLFSAPGYKGSSESDVNMGACVEVGSDMSLTIKQLKVSTAFRKNRVNDMERAKNQRKKVLKSKPSG